MENVGIEKNVFKLSGIKLFKNLKIFKVDKLNLNNIYIKEFLNTKVAIELLDFTQNSISEIEEALVLGIYRMELLNISSKKVKKQNANFSYSELLDLYEHKIQGLRKKNKTGIVAKTKKQILYEKKQIQIDYLARQFSNLNFSKIDLILEANMDIKDIKRIYTNSVKYIKEQSEYLKGPELELRLDNLIGKLQLHLGQFVLKNKENILKAKEKQTIKKITENKFSKIKQIFKINIFKYVKTILGNIKNKTLFLTSGENEFVNQKEIEISTIKYILETVLEIEDFYGSFSEGFLDDKIKIFNLDNVKEVQDSNQANASTITFRNIYLSSGQLIEV